MFVFVVDPDAAQGACVGYLHKFSHMQNWHQYKKRSFDTSYFPLVVEMMC